MAFSSLPTFIRYSRLNCLFKKQYFFGIYLENVCYLHQSSGRFRKHDGTSIDLLRPVKIRNARKGHYNELPSTQRQMKKLRSIERMNDDFHEEHTVGIESSIDEISRHGSKEARDERQERNTR